MKLKLEEKDSITLLTVTEDVKAEHAAVLKAGITRLLQSGKLTIIVDLSTCPTVDASAQAELLAAQKAARALDGQVVIASPIAGFGGAPNAAEAFKSLKTVLTNLVATEARLQARIKKLQARKEAINKQMSAAGTEDIRTIRKEATDFKLLVREMESYLKDLVKSRTDRTPDQDSKSQTTEILNTVFAVLVKQGVLKA